MERDRADLLADDSVTGAAWCRASSDLADAWLAKLLQNACGSDATQGLALVAVGGYGRAELCPQSDIDVILLHANRKDMGQVADRLWYPIWDAGMKLGHSVRTVKEALSLASDDLDTATALLTTRHLAGDPSLTAELADGGRNQWQKRSKRWLTELGKRVDERHQRAGEVAFLLEPDLKEGRGGLRDVHALRWAEAAQRTLFDADLSGLDSAYNVLLDARVELHRRTGRPQNTLLLQEQDGVAADLGYPDADALMAAVAAAARTISWTSDETWRRIGQSLRGPLNKVVRRDRVLGPGLSLRDGEVHVDPAVAPVAADPVLVLRAASLAAENVTAIDRGSLEVLAEQSPPMPDPWPAEARDALAELLLHGPPAIPVIEALDQRGLWVGLLPEWEPTRSRPQRNAYHRFTVDRHLVETAAGAAALADRVRRPDLLVIGALLHDIGKGRSGDHTVNGLFDVQMIGRRMGFGAADLDDLEAMVAYHLLLPEVATRRDLDDPATIDTVAKAVQTLERLELLAALTEADSLATGPSAWGRWKAELVSELVARTAHVLAGGELNDVVTDEFPTAEQRELMARGERAISASDDTLTVIDGDRPGLFSRVAGVLALHGLEVRAAAAYSSDDGVALARFRVHSSFGSAIDWSRVDSDLGKALSGRLALNARIEDRARTYRRRTASGVPATTGVRVDNGASASATVVDVQASDGIGVLYRITRALAELDLDIRSARVETLGPQVVDAFYVVDAAGEKVTDGTYLGEIERAVLAAVGG